MCGDSDGGGSGDDDGGKDFELRELADEVLDAVGSLPVWFWQLCLWLAIVGILWAV